MAVDESSRHQLHVKLEEILGPEEASTLMAHLPPVGWADVATKRDLDAVKNELVATLHKEISSNTRTLVIATSTLNITLAGIAFAAARLT